MNLANALELGDRELVAFVGAGGKKTAMAALVDEAEKRGLRVGYTTTTYTPPPGDVPLVIENADSLSGVLADAPSPVAFAAESVPNPDRATEKVRGFHPEDISELFASGAFDWLLVKADGARRREFKAPGPDEPVIPRAATHVVPIASIHAVGRPLAAPAVHRPERVAALTDLDVGDEVTPDAIGTVLGSDDGGLKGVPSDATVTPVVNKADTPEQRGAARTAIGVALDASERLTRGLVTSFEESYCDVVRNRG